MKKLTKNNKGFSLIELIIVIAIMAVLVAIIAPNLTKYLGSSKTQTDNKNLDEAKTQIKNCIADATTQDISVTTWTTKDLTTISTTSTDSFEQLVANALDGATLTSKVDSTKKMKATITKSGDNYKVTVAFS